MKVILLAAGYATRLYPLTQNKAKALLTLGEGTILDFILTKIKEIPDITSINLVSNAKYYQDFLDHLAQVQNQFKDLPPIRVFNDQSQGETDRLGAIGDLKFCLDQIGRDEDVLILASDNIFSYSLLEAYNIFQNSAYDLLLGCYLDAGYDLSRFAIAEVDSEGFIIDLVEKPIQPKTNLAVFATYFYKQSTLAYIDDYIHRGLPLDSPGLFPAWYCKQRPMKLHQFKGKSFDIGTVATYQEVVNNWPMILDN